jgi:site-specific recombinase XerD
MAMATGKITKRAVDAVQPGPSDAFLWDDELRGFGLKVTPSGKRSYVYQYRIGGRGAKTKRWTIGSHGSPWTATTARAEAERLALLVGQGVDPVEAERVRRKQAETLGFKDYVDTFTDAYLKTEWGDSWPLAKRRLEMYAVPLLKDRPLPEIRAGEIVAIFDKVRDKPALARNLHAVLRKLFNWAEKRDDINVSPMHKIDPPAGAKARKRVLNDDELLALWRATYSLNDPFGPFVRTLVCTLQRRSEVAGLAWPELAHNEQLWRLPGERAKNDADHLVPLNALATAELDLLGWKRRGLLFTTTGKTPISGFSRMKGILDAKMLVELQRIYDERADLAGEPAEKAVIPAWRLHDIRRTGTTRMQGLGVQIEVTEKVINHLSGETAGIRGVYNLWEYLDEKRRALDAWGGWLDNLVSGRTADNVVPIAAARA